MVRHPSAFVLPWSPNLSYNTDPSHIVLCLQDGAPPVLHPLWKLRGLQLQPTPEPQDRQHINLSSFKSNKEHHAYLRGEATSNLMAVQTFGPWSMEMLLICRTLPCGFLLCSVLKAIGAMRVIWLHIFLASIPYWFIEASWGWNYVILWW